ncbi:hypothetical protein [Candidatus Spongiihabitans sp.]|uniref:hypothetical protein n=1 Tax=Candidatus Spongiihabitans sp. TaxID=3101308 RepID=UPI003C7C04B9
MTEIDISAKVELGGIYNIPGEGFVVELQMPDTTYLFDKQGLQHRIIEKKQKGYDATVEETALAQINNFGPVFDTW